MHETTARASEGGQVGVVNAAFTGSTDKITEGNEKDKAVPVASATDSMKLMAKNKTDDQKTSVSSDTDTKQLNSSSSPTPSPERPPEPDPSLHYTYGGDIYAVPNKEDALRRSRSENPILARMQDMVLEHSESRDDGYRVDPVTNITDTAEPVMLLSGSGEEGPLRGSSLIQNPIFQEDGISLESENVDRVGGVRTDLRNDVSGVEEATRSAVDVLDGADGAHGRVSDLAQSAPLTDPAVVNHLAAEVALASVRDADSGGGGVGDVGDQREDVLFKGSLETRWSVDTDGATDEMARAGNNNNKKYWRRTCRCLMVPSLPPPPPPPPPPLLFLYLV